MVRSMTAFARAERHGDSGSLDLELRSVNHRYLEMSLRLPEELRFLEMDLRERIGARLGRGKVECRIGYHPSAAGQELLVDEDLARQVANASRAIDAMLYNPSAVSSMEILRWPGVLQPPRLESGELREQLLDLLDRALDELIATRAREGEQLGALIERRCGAVEEVVEQLRGHLPEVAREMRQRLQERLSEVREELDPARLEQEMLLFAHKMDVSEELDRLMAHVREVRHVLQQERPMGRRLDFLMQELNREANTLASKAADARTTRAAVDLKVLIEQMREQVQNIE
ncbi:MAG TPA: YicC family protein [Gammaproteobacteria bacterium]|nr:YicC family protein [Gammaproteobacteria bacterium]